MSKETKFKYFLDGVEVTKEAIDWTRSLSIRPVKNSDEVHVTYMNFETKPVVNTTAACGMSTRHKACNAGYPKQLSTGRKELKEIEDFVKLIGLLPINTRRTSSADELAHRPIDAKPTRITQEDVAKAMKDYNKGLKQEGFIEDSGFVRETPVGVKHNKHKAPLDIVQTRQFGKALQMIALATAFGNKKYEATDKDFLNFKRVAGGSQTYFDAAARHNTERNEIDEETGLPHVIHAVWDMLAGLELLCEERGVDVKEFSKNYLENLHKSK